MKNCIKFIIIGSLIIAAILNVSNTKAQNPYIKPDRTQIDMYEGETRDQMFYVYNGIVEQLQRMNETDDPIVRMKFEEYYQGSTKFKARFYTLAGIGATHLAAFVIKAVLRGLPGVGIVIVAVEILIALYVVEISTVPILLLPMLALITGQPTTKRKKSKRKRIGIPVNLAFA